MHAELIVRGALAGVEVVHDDSSDLHACEQVSTIGEDNLTAGFDADVFVLLDGVLKDVHHANSIVEADNNLEASWVEGYTVGTFLELLVDLQLEAVRWTVAPNLNSLVRGACRNQVLLNADIHARDRS